MGAPSFLTSVGLDLGSTVAAYSMRRSVALSHLRQRVLKDIQFWGLQIGGHETLLVERGKGTASRGVVALA